MIPSLQGQAHRRRSFLVVDAEGPTATRLLQEEPRQPQQSQPHSKMQECFPGGTICRRETKE